jgi:hypothetical protein
LRPNFKNNWQKLGQKFLNNFFTALLQMVWEVAGLRPNFFSSGLTFTAGLAQESWRDLAAVKDTLSALILISFLGNLKR